MINESKIALLISSSDNYSDAWEPCLKSVEKWWIDCRYEKVLLTESTIPSKNCNFDRVLHINEKDWGKRLHYALEMLEKTYVFFMLEDQWPVQAVDNTQINMALEYMERNPDVAILYLESDGKILDQDSFFYEIPFGQHYRIAAAPCIMKCSFVMEITSNGYTPWDYERIGSFDEKGKEVRVLRLTKSAWMRLAPPGAILRGKWMPMVPDYFMSIGVSTEIRERPIVSFWDMFFFKIKSIIFGINPKLIVRIQNRIYELRNMSRVET